MSTVSRDTRRWLYDRSLAQLPQCIYRSLDYSLDEKDATVERSAMLVVDTLSEVGDDVFLLMSNPSKQCLRSVGRTEYRADLWQVVPQGTGIKCRAERYHPHECREE